MVYIFTYLTPSGGATRHRYLVYYPICFIENLAAIIIWACLCDPDAKQSWYYVPLIVSGIVPFMIGNILVSIVKYILLH